MDLVQAANPIKNYKRKQRHFEFYRSVPCAASYYHGSESYNWVVCRFSPHSENVLYLGGDEGDVGIVDITPVVGSEPNHEAVQIQSFPAHNATVMDVIGVPSNPNQLLSISGDTTARLWDLQRHDSVLFFGHEMSVRSACFAPQSSQVFATGGRDGQIRLWDVRTSSLQQQGQFLKKAVNVYKNAHLMKDHRSPSRRRSVSRLSSRFEKVEPPSVTSLLYANDYTLVSASSCGKSGLRLWDTRKISAKDEGHVLSKLEVPTHKEAGITSICLDRFGSSLFAAVTDNCVYEYGILTSNTKPLRHFTGAAIESFYVQLQCSPSADYLLCGSKNQQAVIWDLQDLYSSFDEKAISSERQCRALLPKYTLKGHDSEACCAGWSRNGKYMVSMDDSHFRVWSADVVNPGKPEANSNIETISTYELNESEKTTLLVTRMSIRRGQGPSGSPTSFASTPSRKRKEPFESPIKRLRTPTKSPISKMMKLVSPVLPFANITNAEAGSSDIASTTTPQSHRRSRKKGAFHYKYPTENLPNKVYERYISKFKARRLAESLGTPSACVESESPSTSKKNLDDYYLRSCLDQTRSLSKAGRSRLPSVTEFGDSVCSKMVSEQHRTQNSPRKLTVKLTPLKSRPLSQMKEQKDSQKRSSRNLLDYFPKKVPFVEPSPASAQDVTTPIRHG